MPDSWHTLHELEGLQVEGLEQVIKLTSHYYPHTKPAAKKTKRKRRDLAVTVTATSQPATHPT
jgi:hypothetical protein